MRCRKTSKEIPNITVLRRKRENVCVLEERENRVELRAREVNGK